MNKDTMIEEGMDPADIKTQFKNFLNDNSSTLKDKSKKCENLDDLEQFLKNTVKKFEVEKKLTKPEKKDNSASKEIVQRFKYPMDNYKLVYDACFTLEQKQNLKKNYNKDNIHRRTFQTEQNDLKTHCYIM